MTSQFYHGYTSTNNYSANFNYHNTDMHGLQESKALCITNYYTATIIIGTVTGSISAVLLVVVIIVLVCIIKRCRMSTKCSRYQKLLQFIYLVCNNPT